jgi:hypothetical protein
MAKPGHLLTAFMDTMKHTRSITPNDIKAMRKRVGMAATRGVKFISPTIPMLDRNTPMRFADLRPPYPVTVIEGQMVPGAVALAIARDLGDCVELNFIAHTAPNTETISGGEGGWFAGPLLFRIPYAETSMHDLEHVEVKALLRDQVGESGLNIGANKPFIRFYASVCQILANNHVTTEDVEPDAKESRMRRIRGKGPLYTYKTLIIGAPKKRQGTGGGGTHASPRSHLRRGYYRTSRNGVRHWVQACMVMGETPGFVHKDYKVEPQGETQ